MRRLFLECVLHSSFACDDGDTLGEGDGDDDGDDGLLTGGHIASSFIS